MVDTYSTPTIKVLVRSQHSKSFYDKEYDQVGHVIELIIARSSIRRLKIHFARFIKFAVTVLTIDNTSLWTIKAVSHNKSLLTYLYHLKQDDLSYTNVHTRRSIHHRHLCPLNVLLLITARTWLNFCTYGFGT